MVEREEILEMSQADKHRFAMGAESENQLRDLKQQLDQLAAEVEAELAHRASNRE